MKIFLCKNFLYKRPFTNIHQSIYFFIKDKLNNDEIIEKFELKLMDYKNQLKIEKVFPMKNPDSYFRIRMRVFWSKLNFFKERFIYAQKTLSEAMIERNSLNIYLSPHPDFNNRNLIEIPFGIILYGEISSIIDEDICTTPREKEEIVEKKRMTILPEATNRNNLSKSFAGKFEGAINKTIKMNVEWSNVKSILLKISLFFSIFQCISTCSFISLITIIIALINHNLQFSLFTEKRKLIDLKLTMYFIMINIGYDIIWLFFRNFVRFNKLKFSYDGIENSKSIFSIIVYILKFINIFILLLILLSLYILHNKSSHLKKDRLTFFKNSFLNSTDPEGLFSRHSHLNESMKRDKGRISTSYFYTNQNKSFLSTRKSMV